MDFTFVSQYATSVNIGIAVATSLVFAGLFWVENWASRQRVQRAMPYQKWNKH